MKKNLISILVILALAIAATGCREWPINGDLDGQWQLMEIKKDGQEAEKPAKRSYVAFQQHVMQFVIPYSIHCNLDFDGKVIKMSIPSISYGNVGRLPFYGIGLDDTYPTPKRGSDKMCAGNGTQASPYIVSQVLGFCVAPNDSDGSNDTNRPNLANIWLKGYIVGWIDDSNQNFADAINGIFSVPATSATNVLLAASPNETDFSKCVAINLPAGKIRSAVNLLDNPYNLGKVVSLCGTVHEGFNIPVLSGITDYKLSFVVGMDWRIVKLDGSHMKVRTESGTILSFRKY